MKEGKKGTGSLLKYSPQNIDIAKCDKCNGDLIKLETMLERAKQIDEDKWWSKLYWICTCTECGRTVKVLDSVVDANGWIVGTSNYKDRSNIGGR